MVIVRKFYDLTLLYVARQWDRLWETDVDFVIGEAAGTAVMSQGCHSEPLPCVCTGVHCSCAEQHLTVHAHPFELWSCPWLSLLHATLVATSAHCASWWSLCYPLRWTKGMPCSAPSLRPVCSGFPPLHSLCSLVRPGFPATWGFPVSSVCLEHGCLPFL